MIYIDFWSIFELVKIWIFLHFLCWNLSFSPVLKQHESVFGMILVLIRQFLMILWKFEKVFFLPKKTIFFKKSIFFSKTSIMEDLCIDVETWILLIINLDACTLKISGFIHTFQILWKKLTLSVSQISMVLHTYTIFKDNVLYAYYSKIFMGNRQTKFFFVKKKTSNIIWKFDGTIIKMEQIEQKLC